MRQILFFGGFLMFFIAGSYCLAYPKAQDGIVSKSSVDVPKSFPRKDNEPANMDPDKLLDSETHYTKELGEYAKEEWEQLESIFSLPRYPSTDPLDIVGEWRLKGYDKATSTATERWRGTDYFDIFELGNPAGTYSFHSSVHHSPIYQGKSGELYIIPTWLYGTLKQLYLMGNRIYIYVLVEDEWVLDPIHESGKNYYERKSKTVNSFYP